MSMKTFMEEKLGKFPQFLVYTILEWIVIVLLFIDGLLAFISNEFAKLFDLRIPCLFCTRIDHLLIHRNPNFYYNDSICEVHKKDISSLAYCNVHKKLSDIRRMCDGCLLSFASDCARYKSLLGILDMDSLVEDDQKTCTKSGKNDEALQFDANGVTRCSCCGDPLKARTSSKKFNRSPSTNAHAPTPSPRAATLSWKNEEARNVELPHIQYTELKVMSDNESEIPEDEDASTGDNRCREDIKAATVPLLPDSETINEDAASRTPLFGRGNKFFGIPLSDSAQASPRYKAAKKLFLDNLELGLEPNHTNAGNDADRDSILARMKRQVRLDRKSLVEMYMELDEERSASAVAANNAMAMITRLQAEKAAVQMEALQYQRMMEEQAEYDQEALQVMKDLVVKREEEIKVLESELKVYREKHGSIKKIGSDVCEIDDDDEDYEGLKSQSQSSFGEKSECGSPIKTDQNGINGYSFDCSEDLGAGNVDESSLDFEGERSYLLGLLKDVERNRNLPSEEGSHFSESNLEDRDTENKPAFARELALIKERLRAIEADSGFLKHAAMTLQKSGEGTKLLTEIAQHLRNLRYSVKIPMDDIDA